MRNILVTGGAGFIGSNLVFEVEKRFPQCQITVVDDFRATKFKNLLGFKGDVLAYDLAQCGPEGSAPLLQEIFKDRPLDTIFHLASITDTTVLDEKKMIFDNVEGFRNVLKLAVAKKCGVVYASSAGVYGSQETPMKEEDAGKPNNVYGFSKWVMDQLARNYFDRLKITGLRFFNVFGPGEGFKGSAASMIYQLYLQMKAGKRPRIFKWGEQRRDFIYVKDVVEALLLAREAKKNTIVNVGTGESTSFNEVIEVLNEGMETDLKPDYFDNPYDFYQNFTQADTARARKEIGFEAKYPTREGVLHYVKNYLLPSAPQLSPAPA